MQRLKEAAEKAKIELSSAQSTDVNLPFLTADSSGPKHLNVSLSRSKFEQLIADIVQRTLAPCMQVLKDAKLSVEEVQEVLLVGGSTRIPLVQQKVKDFFKREPNRTVNPDEVVAIGAAVQGGVLAGDVKDVLLLDVTPFSLGVETAGGLCEAVIRRNATIPVEQSRNFATTNDQQDSVIIRISQGESRKFQDNTALGELELTNLRPAPRGEVVVSVTFELEADGTLRVRAKDVETGREQVVRVNLLTIPSEHDQADMTARNRGAVVPVP
jgi:molecular chaperone DnaK